MPVFVENLGLMGACFAGLEGAGGAVLADASVIASAKPFAAAADAEDRYISAGQRLPSLLTRGRDSLLEAASLAPQPLPVSLRDYQEGFASEMIRRHRLGQDRGLLVLPTGAGKTIGVVETLRRLAVKWNEAKSFDRYSSAGIWQPANWRRIADFHRSLRRPEGILFVAHRDFLLKQAAGVLGRVFSEEAIGLVQGNTLEWEKPVVIASAQTLIGVLDQMPKDKFGLTVLDEAHHYVPENIWSGVLRLLGFINEEGAIQGNWPRLLVGMTATPDRLTGQPLLNVYGPEGLVTALDAADLWEWKDKVVLKPEVIAVSLNASVNDISGENLGKLLAKLFYDQLNRGDQFHHTLVYVNNVVQIPEVVTALNALGISAEGLTGGTPKEEREEILDRFAAGITRVLVNVGVAGEGFDVPSVETVVLAFESESRTRVVQAIGRAMRVDPERPEKEALVIDLGGNTRRHRLSIQIREAYEAEGVRLTATGEKQRSREARSREAEKQEAEIEEVGELTFQGEKPVTQFIEEAFAKLKISPSEMQKVAYRLGTPSDILFAYANGLQVPSSLTEVINIAREIGDAEGLLHDAWAKEKTAQMELTQPLPKEMGEKTREWVRYLRYSLWHRHEGVTSRVAGMETKTVQNLIQEGDFFGWPREIWEEKAAKILTGFAIARKGKDILDKLNGYLEERKCPLFEEWMITASTEAILIFRLKQLAQQLGRSPTRDEVDAEEGVASARPYLNLFGSWNKALLAAGLKVNQVKTKKTRGELIADLKALAQRLGRSPTRDEVDAEEGTASVATYKRVFGSFNKALIAAELKINRVVTNKTREELIADLKALAQRLGRSPTGDEVDAEERMASPTTYFNVFGGFNNAFIVAELTQRKRGQKIK